MTDSLSRRGVLAAGALLLPGFAQAAEAPFAALEKQSGARIGVAALDTASGKRIAWRADERFVMCSTFKLSLAAAFLARAQSGAENLEDLIHYDKSALLGVSPVTTRNLDRGMTVGEMCEAVVIYSDNGAANLLLARLGGPAALTRFWRQIGDPISRLDNNEPKLNVRDGERNTTMPAATLRNLNTLLLGRVLTAESRERLLGWMLASTTGLARLRAGLPGWKVGDKTGTGPGGEANDIAIAWPSPARAPVLICAYTVGGTDAVIAEIGRIVAGAFA